jgi:hypothetical protein
MEIMGAGKCSACAVAHVRMHLARNARAPCKRDNVSAHPVPREQLIQ